MSTEQKESFWKNSEVKLATGFVVGLVTLGFAIGFIQAALALAK